MKRRLHPEQSGLNLAPILNLVMILIPLLLISIEFEQLGVINVNVPRFVNVTPGPEVESLALTVAITHAGFILATKGEKLPLIPRKTAGGPAEPSRYDFEALYVKLAALKQTQPSETTLSLSADPDIPYEMVIETMDNVRWKRRDEGERPDPLFPDVTLAVLQ
jgi:biopolymer transport protein TolR